MVQLSSALAACALLLTATAAPLSLPIGNTGQTLTISNDGQFISIAGRTVSISQAMNSRSSANSCASERKNKNGKEQGNRKGQGKANEANEQPAEVAAAAVTNAKAIYFITNAAQNSIVALNVAADGTLSDGSITPTGGQGSQGIQDGAPAAPDSLFSQSAVRVAGNNLVAVNAGSNTISMFAIDPTDPTKLEMVGQPADTLGEFPLSVTLSTQLNMACVANSGAQNGIACFSMSAQGLTPIDTSLRSLGLTQTTPPVGPTNTVSQTFFNADSTALFTTVKGDPAVNNTGFLSVFPIVNGALAAQDVRSSPNGTAVLFGSTPIPGTGDIFVTDASFGSATLGLSADNIATVKASTQIADQAATCWAAISAVTGSAYVTDVGVNHLVEIDTQTGELIQDLESTNGNPGMIDLVSAGNFIYALSPGTADIQSAVTVFDVSGGRGNAREIQNFQPAGVEATAMGMTFI